MWNPVMWGPMRVAAAAGVALLVAAAPAPALAQAAGGDFQAWLAGLRAEAEDRGIGTATLDAALSGLTPIPRVIELDRRQPEGTLTFAQYMDRVVPDSRVDTARERLRQHETLLDEVTAEYGVPARIIVALWGVESDFGRIAGNFPVIDALATLAHDERRSAYFRRQLLYALEIVDQGHIELDRMLGSWAGAMGQPQFMPESFASYAVDHDGDGRRDIWGTEADVFASAANYLARNGWREGQTWGRPVRLPPGFDTSLVGLETTRSLPEWQALGVRRADGGDLPHVAFEASIIQPGGAGGPAYVVYENFRVLMRWNRSQYFATAVGTLADRLATP